MRLFFLISALVAAPFYALAADAEPAEVLVRFQRNHIHTVLSADGSNVRTYDLMRTPVSDKVLEAMKSASISYSTSVEKLDLLEAYTQKAGGRRIDVPQANQQVEVNSGRNGASPAFSDRTTLTLIYPELASGDTTVLRYRITQTEPIFPGHFSVRDTFATAYAYDDVRITIDAPAALRIRHSQNGMKARTSSGNGRQVVEWTWANPKPIQVKRRNWSVMDPDREVGYAYTTFASYAEIAQAYGARARPKALPNERVRKLAAEVVGDRADRREQARALYEWVATKVDYAGNCIGVGVVVPRDLDFVLDNRMGDCKDHATLLQALLAARGIESTQALVNAGSIYRLPLLPVVSSVNHVINYVPEFGLFLDSTSSSTPFGMLPRQIADKPVLLVDGYRDGLRTPVPPQGAGRQHMKTIGEIRSDGSIAATIRVEQTGYLAANSREWMRRFKKDDEADFVKNAFQRGGLTASGTLQKDDPTALLDTYGFGLTLDLKGVLQRPGAGAFPIGPLFGTEAPVAAFVISALDNDQTVDVACTSGESVEEYSFTLPTDMEIIAKPDDLKLENDVLTYEATYKLDGRRLSVVRRIEDRTKGTVCSPSQMAQYREFALKVMPNLRAQVLYK